MFLKQKGMKFIAYCIVLLSLVVALILEVALPISLLLFENIDVPMHIKAINTPVVDIEEDRPFLDIIMKEVNDFLKTRFGLQYLIMRFPELPVEQAVKEYSFAIYQANYYDVQDMW